MALCLWQMIRWMLIAHALSLQLSGALASPDRSDTLSASLAANNTLSRSNDSASAAGDVDVTSAATTSPGRGRGMMSNLGHQATHIGRGLMDLFRVGGAGGGGGGPQLTRRGTPVHHHYPGHPGQPVRRPRPFPPPANAVHPQRGPGSHVQGPNGFVSNQLEGGFLPVDKMAEAASAPSSSVFKKSAVLSNSTVEFPNSKPPCDFYTDSLCIESDPYPYDRLWRTVRNELPRLQHMMVDVQAQNANDLVDGVSLQEEVLYTYEHYYGSQNNNTHVYRDYGADGGFVCPSDIQYVRLKRAKNLRNQWKNIVNFDDFTQTIRVEKCLKPFSRCSYVFSYLNSECIQIYNYQRLVSWTEDKGFHVDIYKIPTACSCHLKSSSLLRRQTTTKEHLRSSSSTIRPTTTTTTTAAASHEVDHAADNEISKNDLPAPATTRSPIKLLSHTSQPLPSSFDDSPPSPAFKTPMKQPDSSSLQSASNPMVMIYTPTVSDTKTKAIDSKYRYHPMPPSPQQQPHGPHPGINPKQHQGFRMTPNFRRNAPYQPHFPNVKNPMMAAGQDNRVGSPMVAPPLGGVSGEDQALMAKHQHGGVGPFMRYPPPRQPGVGQPLGRPFGRFQLPYDRRRHEQQVVGHRSSGERPVSVEADGTTPASSVRRVNFSRNPVSDFMHQWNA